MDEEIDFHLLSSFNETVEKAQAAIDTAQDADNSDMLKAAQGLLKEGERARKAINTMAQRQLVQYKQNFVDAIKDHDGIAEHIEALSDLVFVFDDYTEPDSFDAEKFKELGKTAQNAAMRITHILRRMKLEAPSAPEAPLTASTPSTPLLGTASPYVTVVSRADSIGGQSTASYYSSTVVARSPHPDDGEVAPVRLPSLPRSDTVVHVGPGSLPRLPDERPRMGTQGGPELGWNNGQQPDPSAASPTMSRNSIVSPILPPIHEPPSIPESAPTPEPPHIPEPPPPPSLPEPAPPLPATNPWQIGARPSVGTIIEEQEGDEEGSGGPNGSEGGSSVNGANGQAGDLDALERRRRISTRPDSPTLPSPTGPDGSVAAGSTHEFTLQMIPPPPPPTSSFPPSPPRQYTRRLDDGVDLWQQQVEHEERRQRGSADASPRTMYMRPEQLTSPPANVPAMFAPRSVPSQQFPPPQQFPLAQNYSSSEQQQRQSITGPTSAPGVVSPRQSQISTMTASTASSTNGSVFSFDSHINGLSNELRDSSLDPISPVIIPAASPVSPDGGPQTQLLASFASGSSQSPSAPMAAPQVLSEEQPGLEMMPPAVHIDPGLIPVHSPIQEPGHAGALIERASRPRTADCNIGLSSSFHLFKGFCEGAKAVQRGEAGVRQIKKLSYSGAGAYAAKCTNCLYELQWAEVEKDRQNQSSANYRMHGIGFRLRFLSKCHLRAKMVDDPLYACIFCLQDGRTLEESDATVFFSQGQLFSHLSRHPRPLPHVPGVTVIDGPERPPENRNNYDLHFVAPPMHSELDGIRRELLQLPTGVAVETFRKSHGTLRKPSDNVMPIQFPAGAKIVGIEFPAIYKGEWAVGWFDNVRGPFPAECVRLDPPPRNEIRAQGTSALQATVRWKWASGSAYRNSDSDWLRLDRNETVSNIIWTYTEHWCWAGTNTRGKWGYFPQSHIEPNSLKEVQQTSDAASMVSQERGGPSGGFLSRLRSHNSHNNAPSLKRPVSIASHSTTSSR